MPLPFGFVLDNGPPSDDDVSSYIIEAARKRGIPEQDALDVWAGEGKGAWQSNFVKNGKRERSYGPYQLYVDGGLGNAFQRDTGLDPSDPSTWKQGVDYALDTAKKEGWGQWYGAPAHLRKRGGYNDEPMLLAPAGAKKGGLPPGFQLDKPRAEEAPTQAAPAPAPEEKPYTPTPWGEIGDDAARATISGTIGGIANVAGMPGSLGDWLKSWSGDDSSWLTDALAHLPNMDETNKAVTDTIGDYSYQPQTGAGEIAGTIAGIASGGPLLGRSGSAVRGTAKKVAEVVGGGAAAELGGEIGGTPGAVAGAVLATHQLGKPIVARGQPAAQAADRARSEADMVMSPETAARARRAAHHYHQLDNMGINIPINQVGNLQNIILQGDDLAALGFTPQKFPGLARKVEQMLDPMNAMTGSGGNGIGFRQFDNMRQQILKYARTSKDAQERMLAGTVVDRMDEFFDEFTQGLTGNAALTAQRARNEWRIFRKSEHVDQMAEEIKDKASRFSVSGEDNATRDVFSRLSLKITRDARARNQFTPAEIRLIRKLARGDDVRHALRQVGAALNNPFVRGGALLAGAGGSWYTGDSTPFWGAVASVLGGKAARGAASFTARRGNKQLGRLVRSGGEMTPPAHPMVAGLMALNPYLGQ